VHVAINYHTIFIPTTSSTASAIMDETMSGEYSSGLLLLMM
jgi:hypothetical protein